MRPSLLFRVLPAAVLLLAACESQSTSPSQRVPARIVVVSGDAQSGAAGDPLASPLVARIDDAKGRPVPGRPVEFRVTAGGGTVMTETAESDAEGMVRARWTLG